MSSGRDLNDGMPHDPIDPFSAERILSGHPPSGEEPAARELFELFSRLNAPASPWELSAESEVVAKAVAAVSTSPQAGLDPRKKRPMISKLLTGKALAAAVVAAMGASAAAAAATGNLPSLGSTTHVSTFVAPAATTTTDGQATTLNNNKTDAASTSTSVPMTGPANAHALYGLCTAFLAGSHGYSPTSGSGSSTSASSSQPGSRDSSTAFSALIKEMGGTASAAAANCQKYLATHDASDNASPESTDSTSAQPGSEGTDHRAPQATDHASSSEAADHSKASGSDSAAGDH